MNPLRALLVLAVAGASGACQPAPQDPIRISEAYSRSTPPGSSMGGAYMVIESRDGDVLESAETPVAAAVEMHVSEQRDGMTTMRPLTHVSIAAGGRFEFAPGGAHFMLIGLVAPLEAGTKFPMTLHFRTAGDVATTIRVIAPDQAPKP